MPDYARLAYHLWKLLDDIDTAGDAAKNDDEAFRGMVEKIQKRRWQFATEDIVESLYQRYGTLPPSEPEKEDNRILPPYWT